MSGQVRLESIRTVLQAVPPYNVQPSVTLTLIFLVPSYAQHGPAIGTTIQLYKVAAWFHHEWTETELAALTT